MFELYTLFVSGLSTATWKHSPTILSPFNAKAKSFVKVAMPHSLGREVPTKPMFRVKRNNQ